MRTVRNLTDHLNRAGTGVRGAVSPGEMVNLSTEDAHKTGSFIFQLGFGWMGLVMTAVGAVLLWRASPALGWTTLIGVLLSVSGSAWILLPWTISRIIDEVLLAGSAEP
ncbi:hypothetical protein ADL26_19420, partial [Thermoactinomyces vulgaris]